MAKEKRKDKSRVVLRTGESQRADGTKKQRYLPILVDGRKQKEALCLCEELR